MNTYVEVVVYERVVAGIAHRQPVEAEPDYVDVLISGTEMEDNNK